MSQFPLLVQFKLMRPGAQLPKRGTDGSGAFDFFVPEDGSLFPGDKKLIPSGVAHEMPGEIWLSLAGRDGDGPVVAREFPFRLQGILFDRSGLGHKKGIRLSFTGLIDNDYRGEIFLSMENTSSEYFAWKAGERLCQIGYTLMYAGATAATETLDETARGAGGFGSTGTR